MKVKCVRILNADGCELEFSPWLTLDRVYHAFSMSIDQNSERSYGVISGYQEAQWAHIGNDQQRCFEVVSDILPSSRRTIVREGFRDISPAAWEENGSYEAFANHDPSTYPIFQREKHVVSLS